MENTCLYHAGVKGMRWGVRRYQNPDGSLTPAGKKRYAKAEAAKAKVKAKDAKAKARIAKSSEKEKTKETTTEEKKSAVLKSRSAKEVYKNRRLFNLKEMEETYKLLKYDTMVKDMIVKEPRKIDKFFDETVIPWSKRINDLSANVSGIVGNFDKISKFFDGDSASDTGNSTPNNEKKKNKAGKQDKSNDKNDKVDNSGKTKNKSDGPSETTSKQNRSDDSVSGDWIRNEKKTKTSSTSPGPKTTFWDVDYEDSSSSSYPAIDVDKLFGGSLTPSRATTTLVSNHSATSVASLPAPSSQAQSFVAGLLAPPKDKE